MSSYWKYTYLSRNGAWEFGGWGRRGGAGDSLQIALSYLHTVTLAAIMIHDPLHNTPENTNHRTLVGVRTRSAVGQLPSQDNYTHDWGHMAPWHRRFLLYYMNIWIYTFEQGSNLYMYRPPLGYERIFSDYIVFHKLTAWDRLLQYKYNRTLVLS